MLRAFVHGLELFIAGLGPDEQIVWTDTLFQGNANGIAEFNDRVQRASSTVERSMELDSVRNTDINDWLGEVSLVQTVSSKDATTPG